LINSKSISAMSNNMLAGAAAGSAGTALASFIMLSRYLSKELKKPQLLHASVNSRDTAEDQHLLQEVKLLLRDYWPHPILEFSGYTSTFWSGFWAVLPSRAHGEMETLTLNDGGTVSLHWFEPPEMQFQDRIVLVLPGLNNDSRTSFIQGTMSHLRAGGFQAVTLNYRGTAGLQLTSPRLGCADSWTDINQVVDHILKKHPNAMLFGMGFSMGAGMLMRYLGMEGDRCRLRAGVALAGPTDYPAMSRYIESTWKKRLVNWIMVNGVKLFMMRSFFTSPYCKDLSRRDILAAKNLRELEEASICKLHGYADSADYYKSNDPLPVLGQISVPTLVVNAEDDPVVGISTLARDELSKNSRIYTVVTKRGGHIGWGSGGLGASAWTDDMAVDFFQACAIRPRRSVSASRSKL